MGPGLRRLAGSKGLRGLRGLRGLKDWEPRVQCSTRAEDAEQLLLLPPNFSTINPKLETRNPELETVNPAIVP